MSSATIIVTVILAVIMLIIGLTIGYVMRKHVHEKELNAAKDTAAGIIATAKKEAATKKREILLEAKDESHRYQTRIEDELKYPGIIRVTVIRETRAVEVAR